jgi:hypothetical protein
MQRITSIDRSPQDLLKKKKNQVSKISAYNLAVGTWQVGLLVDYRMDAYTVRSGLQACTV